MRSSRLRTVSSSMRRLGIAPSNIPHRHHAALRSRWARRSRTRKHQGQSSAPLSGASQKGGGGVAIAPENADQEGENAVVEEDRADRERSLARSGKAQSGAETLGDEHGRRKSERLLAEQGAIEQIADQPDHEGAHRPDSARRLDREQSSTNAGQVGLSQDEAPGQGMATSRVGDGHGPQQQGAPRAMRAHGVSRPAASAPRGPTALPCRVRSWRLGGRWRPGSLHARRIRLRPPCPPRDRPGRRRPIPR